MRCFWLAKDYDLGKEAIEFHRNIGGAEAGGVSKALGGALAAREKEFKDLKKKQDWDKKDWGRDRDRGSGWGSAWGQDSYKRDRDEGGGSGWGHRDYQANVSGDGWGKFSGEERPPPPPPAAASWGGAASGLPYGDDDCRYCKQPGHWAGECPILIAKKGKGGKGSKGKGKDNGGWN